jgi:exonuclease SbcC
MKIHSIEIEGFWSYRDPQAIDISGLPIVIGVGENGAGKSTLLVSAILVAFYGKFPTDTPDESITTGASQGRVSVEFSIGDTRYRVGRVYPRVGAAKGVVSVQDADASTGWRSLTNAGAKEVNAYMVEILGMDYVTATMTWVAQQGEYGKFSAALPSKRFELLAAVFGLDIYSDMAKLAAVQAKAADTAVTGLDGRISEVLDTIDQVDAESDLSGYAGVSDADLEERRAVAEAEIDRVGLALAEVNAADPARQTVEARQALELVRNERVNKFETATAAVARATRSANDARSRAAAADNAAETRYTQTVAEAQKRTADTRVSAEQTRAAAVKALADIAAARRELPSLADQVTGEREAAADSRDAATAATKAEAAATTNKEVLLAEWATLKQLVADAGARIETLRRSAADADHAECFTCGQHLSAADSLALIASQERDIVAATTRQAAVKAEGATAAAAIVAAAAARDAALTNAAAHEAAATAASAAVSRAEALIATAAERQDAADDTDIAVNRAVAAEEAAIAAAATERTAAIEANASESAAASAAAEAEIATAQTIIAKTAEPTDRELSLARALAAAEAVVADAVAGVEAQRSSLITERDRFRTDFSVLGAELTRRTKTAEARAEYQLRLAALRVDRDVADRQRIVFETLHKAYSPSGIPAMILAGVVDELNESVNHALERLSRGELRIQLRASRETKSGTVENKIFVYVETGTGVFPYKSLSGGQKFRVDVAIRVGLAKAVARGSGTPIQTFILDEGWGTLDEKGVLDTVDTVFALSDEMNVITVSHVGPVIDAFPARVNVDYSTGTSVAEVIR